MPPEIKPIEDLKPSEIEVRPQPVDQIITEAEKRNPSLGAIFQAIKEGKHQEVISLSANLQEEDYVSILIVVIKKDIIKLMQPMLYKLFSPEALARLIYEMCCMFVDNNVSLLEQSFNTKIEIHLNRFHFKHNFTLHTAVKHKKPNSLITLLCENGADPNRLNDEGLSPLDLALCSSQLGTVRALIPFVNPSDQWISKNLIESLKTLMRYKFHDEALELFEHLQSRVSTDQKSLLFIEAIFYESVALSLKSASTLPVVIKEKSIISIFETSLVSQEMCLIINKIHPALYWQSWRLWELLKPYNFLLLEAIQDRNSIKNIIFLCQKGAEILSPGSHGKPSPLQAAVATGDFEIVRAMFISTPRTFSGEEIETIKSLLLKSELTYLIIDLLIKVQKDSPKTKKKQLSQTLYPIANEPLSWEIFVFLLNTTSSKVIITACIDKHISLLRNENEGLQLTIKHYACLASYYYIEHHKQLKSKIRGVNDCTIFLKRLLCDKTLTSSEDIQLEWEEFINGKGTYSHWFFKNSTHQVRVGYSNMELKF